RVVDLHSFPTRRSSDLGAERLGFDFVRKEMHRAVSEESVRSIGVIAAATVAASQVIDPGGSIIESHIARLEPVDPRVGTLDNGKDRKSTRLNSSHVKIS